MRLDNNYFAPLYNMVEDYEYDSVSTPLVTKVIEDVPSAQSPVGKPPRHPRLSRLERRLPNRMIAAATRKSSDSLLIRVELQSAVDQRIVSTDALIDSGATSIGYVDKDYAAESGLPVTRLQRPIPVFNVDGSPNADGPITEIVDVTLSYDGHSERALLAVASLGKQDLILGHSWLKLHNPDIDWKSGKVKLNRCSHCGKCKEEVRSDIRNLRLKREAEARERKQQERDRKRCCSGPAPRVEELENDDEEEDEDESDTPPTFGCDIDDEFPDDVQIAEGDRVFMTSLWPEQEFIRATSTFSQRLAEAYAKNAPRSVKDNLPAHFYDFQDVFAKESFDVLPDRKPWDHAIELVPDAKPVNCKVYPVSPAEQKPLDEFIAENLCTGRIRPSKSPMASPVFFVKKKDGGLRLVQDYRRLNDVTIKNSYPLPLISDMINKLSKAKFYTKLDVRWGYNNIRMREGYEWKAAFRTNRGLFEPLVMFFGFTNSPATFQTMMNDLFKELIDEGVVLVYMDDILIYTETLEEHRKVVKRVLQILKDNKLYLKAEKCEFEQQKVEYLGLIISPGRIEMDPVKVEGVANWPIPPNMKEVQSFLGFTNFYRQFIQDFADVARPLHDLTKKDIPWEWNTEHQAAFDNLKKAITSSPVLIFPSDDKPYRVEADSSGHASGAVLSQEGEDGKWHPVAFLSKSLSEVERNYDVHDKEMLAIIRALEEWRHYLEGTKHTFQIWTDHKNLEYFMTAKKLNRRQARWSLFLSRFNFTLHHRPGKKSLKPDALSRRPDHGKGEHDNEDVTLLKPSYFQIHALKRGHVLLTGEETDLLHKIRQAKEFDDTVVKAVAELKTSGAKGVIAQEWSEEQGLVLFRGKVYVPKDMLLRKQIVEAHHDTPVAGHPGRWKTLELVSRNYWWPGMSRYVAAYIKGYDRCNRTKIFPAKPFGKLTPTQIPTENWQTISVDLITGLPESQDYNAIMVVVDRLSKLLHAMPTTDKVTSAGVARLFRDNVWKHHGFPEQIISDRGPQFVSQFMPELNSILGTKTSASTAWHPQTDGQTESANQEIEQYLRLFVNHRQDDWAEWLPLAEFSHNNRVQASPRQTPFMLNNGRHPRTGVEPFRESRNQSVDDFVKKMQAAKKEEKQPFTEQLMIWPDIMICIEKRLLHINQEI